jgi:hypothetical protein
VPGDDSAKRTEEEMLNLLDELLRKILMDGVIGLTPVPQPPAQPPPRLPVDEHQVGFRPPDDQWVSDVKTLQLNALNVYLVELRENRKLRTNERTREPQNGIVYEYPAPARVDCHYLISAWSPTEQLTPQVEPVFDEHALLYETAAVLFGSAPFNPSRIYPTNSQALNAWGEYRDVDLPAVVVPHEGFPKLAEFWGTMGPNHRWRPVLYLIVTIPVALVREQAGYMVTTRITEYRQMDKPETAEIWIQIGGHVFKKSGNANVEIPDAWVGLETATGDPLQSTKTNALGRYTFAKLQSGQYKLKARATGFPEKERPIDVPSPTGEYDVTFP